MTFERVIYCQIKLGLGLKQTVESMAFYLMEDTALLYINELYVTLNN